MLSLAPVGPPPEEGQSGYWIQVRSSEGQVVYHRPLHDPMRTTVEVFGDAPGQPMRRVTNANPVGEFEVLVPDLPEASDFALYGPTPGAKPGARSEQLVRHSFDELRRMATNLPERE